jgi:hypothetical protein
MFLAPDEQFEYFFVFVDQNDYNVAALWDRSVG